MPCLLWAELHEKLICGSKMMVKRNLHFSAPEDLVLWVNWWLFFLVCLLSFLFYWLILVNSINALSSHQILTNLRLNLIFGAGIGVLVRLWFFIDNEKSVRFLTFCWVSFTVGQNQENIRYWYCFCKTYCSKNLAEILLNSPRAIYAAKRSDLDKNNWNWNWNCLFLLWCLF